LSDPEEQDMSLLPHLLDLILKKEDYSTFLVIILANLGYLNLSPEMVITMTSEQLKKEFE